MTLSRLDDNDSVIRRFDPERVETYTTDDSGAPAILRQSAFRFDPEDAYGLMGCSVYSSDALKQLELSPGDCVEARNPHWRIAQASVSDVRSVIRPNIPDSRSPFDAIEDPVTDGNPPHARDAAHALVTHEIGLPGSSKWYQQLALQFQVK